MQQTPYNVLSLFARQVSEAAQCDHPDHGSDPALLRGLDGGVGPGGRPAQPPQAHDGGDLGDRALAAHRRPAVSLPPRSHDPAADPLAGSGCLGAAAPVQGQKAAGPGAEFRNHPGESEPSAEYRAELY